MSDKGAKADLAVVEIAGGQYGVVSTRQLRAAGLDSHGIHHRARTGRLHRVHRGVYAVGHSALSNEARWMAAILACGRNGRATGSVLDFWGAALSHRAAASIWGLLQPRIGPVDVSVPGDGGRKKRKGIRLHRCVSLLSAHVTLRGGIPVTTPARTVADLRQAASKDERRGLLTPRELRRAVRQANVLGLPIGDEGRADRTRSDLEADFLALCRRYRFPPPEVNVRVGRHLVDFFWRDARVVVETDGYIYHSGQVAFEDDHKRDTELLIAGFSVLRFADRQVDTEPDVVARAVAVALSAAP